MTFSDHLPGRDGVREFLLAPVWRRAVLFLLTASSTALAAVMMEDILSANGLRWIELGILMLFVLSFTWIGLSFWTAVIGFVIRQMGFHPLTGLLRLPQGRLRALPLRSRTALVMPIRLEDPERVFAGLASMYRSLERTGELAAFDFYILSDTPDGEAAAEEEAAWRKLREELKGHDRLFYRRRTENSGRKAGNIAEFCRRWGRAYVFMLVVDADSVMTGERIVWLARAMELNEDAGLIQSPPVPVLHGTVFARYLQFSSRLYSPILSYGLSFWAADSSNYWGHNAIIRTRAFMDHCGLARLTGRPPFGGDVLSHDFVEAALLRRAGWKVFLAPETGGSYEEVPTDIIGFAKRDRRWAQGNLQHLKLIGLAGLHPVNRLHFLLGAFAYLSSPVWLVLILFSGAEIARDAFVSHDYFAAGITLFPDWPVYKVTEIFSLLAFTLAVLFAPKLLAIIDTALDAGERRAFGGLPRLLTGAALETAFSILIAPVMMLFHTRFVVSILSGTAVGWGAQVREGGGIGWLDAGRVALFPTLVGAVWFLFVHWTAPAFIWWMMPILLGLLLSWPLVVLTSRQFAGRLLARAGLWLTPEEIEPHRELADVSHYARRLQAAPPPLDMVSATTPEEQPGTMVAQPYEWWTARWRKARPPRWAAGRQLDRP